MHSRLDSCIGSFFDLTKHNINHDDLTDIDSVVSRQLKLNLHQLLV